jgi:microcystin degradation protein MlrC|eukprot:COSAG03_NODE_452_length_7787_cov_30.352107_1_plen_154_part_00
MVEVVSLVDNATFSSNNGNLRSSLGPCALVRINYPEEDGGGSIHVVLSTSRSQVVNPDVWESFGIDPFTFDILVVKSTNHFFGGFGSIASVICYVDTGMKDGLTPYPNDPSQTAYTKLSRPMWPREADPHGIGSKAVPWNAEVEELVEAVARL